MLEVLIVIVGSVVLVSLLVLVFLCAVAPVILDVSDAERAGAVKGVDWQDAPASLPHSRTAPLSS